MWTRGLHARRGGKFRDAVETKLKVTFPTPLLREVKPAARGCGRGTNLLAGVDPALMQGRGHRAREHFANSRIFELRESVGELLHYPYGCVEQTTSSMLPWLGLRDFRDDAAGAESHRRGVPGGDREGRGADSITMQTSDGGLAYWPGGHAVRNIWASAYGATRSGDGAKGGLRSG